MASGRVWLLTALYFALVVFFYGVGLWLPEIIKDMGVEDDLTIGWLSSIPNLVAMIGMVYVGGHSDRTGERRWHVALSAFAGGVCLALCAFAPNAILQFSLLCLALTGLRSALGPFWALSTSFLSGTAAAGSIAFINSFGNLGGQVGPSILGLIKKHTDSFQGGLLFLAASSIVAGFLALAVRPEGSSSRQ